MREVTLILPEKEDVDRLVRYAMSQTLRLVADTLRASADSIDRLRYKIERRENTIYADHSESEPESESATAAAF